jgi:hypothetical protein
MIGVSPFGLLQLAKDDRTGAFQTRDDGGVLGRTEIAMDRHAVRGRCALGPAEILHRDGHAMQRPFDLAGRDFLLSCGRFRQCGIGHDISVTLQLAIKPLNSFEHRLGHFNRR